MTYYVVIGCLMSYNRWEQHLIVPFDNMDEAKKYMDKFLSRNKTHNALIVESNMFTYCSMFEG